MTISFFEKSRYFIPISILKASSLSLSLFPSWSSTKILAYTKGRKKQASCYGILLLVHKHQHCTTPAAAPLVYILRERGGTSYDNGCERGLYKKNIWWLWPPVVRPNYSLSCKEGQVPTIINHSQECLVEHYVNHEGVAWFQNFESFHNKF